MHNYCNVSHCTTTGMYVRCMHHKLCSAGECFTSVLLHAVPCFIHTLPVERKMVPSLLYSRMTHRCLCLQATPHCSRKALGGKSAGCECSQHYISQQQRQVAKPGSQAGLLDYCSQLRTADPCVVPPSAPCCYCHQSDQHALQAVPGVSGECSGNGKQVRG